MTAVVPLLQVMQTKGIGPRSLARLLERIERNGMDLAEFVALAPQAIAEEYGLTEEQAIAVVANEDVAVRLGELLEQHAVVAATVGEPLYPERLRQVLGDKAPPALFMAGAASLLGGRAVGFCGARDASEKSLHYAGLLAAALARRGILVVSGNAHGADEAAHRAALEAGGATAFVLPEGILHFRPKPSLAGLLSDEHFVVVSEFPPKLPWSVANAMQRNRTICALSHAMIVVESGTSGGTWEAGQDALKLGTPLFVLDFEDPAPSAHGNALLVKKGAMPLRCRSGELSDIQVICDAIDAARIDVRQPSLF